MEKKNQTMAETIPFEAKEDIDLYNELQQLPKCSRNLYNDAGFNRRSH